ncbi:DUF1697 domain-containing protein [uncultured Lutibacter sp.]|uniref:DUF1697 domain-containing protein n=1 Tax=uncultured Lutibacter sp. TaxID=437739 RepID=UPI00262767CF|nr:DUF1697 domain-containing protein [uncultured Lutibacter sp.]
MNTYIALLRGINVSGKNIIKMADLKQLLTANGFIEVQTYIQSGNVIFKLNEKVTEKIEFQISNILNKQYQYNVNVLVLTKKQLDCIFQSNPFIEKNNAIDISKMYVTLLNNNPDLSGVSKIESLISTNDDAFIISGKTIYLHCPNGYGKTKLSNNLFESKLKSPATSRNWKTITKLVQLTNERLE